MLPGFLSRLHSPSAVLRPTSKDNHPVPGTQKSLPRTTSCMLCTSAFSQPPPGPLVLPSSSSHWPGRGHLGTTDGTWFAGADTPIQGKNRVLFSCFLRFAHVAPLAALPFLLCLPQPPSSPPAADWCVCVCGGVLLLTGVCVGGGVRRWGAWGCWSVQLGGNAAWDLQEASLGSCDFTLTWPVSSDRPQAQPCPTGPSGLA